MTDDHSLAGMLLRANLITEEMARVHEGRCQLEHYIGGPLPNEIPVRTATLAPGEYLLICSDGVSNTLTDALIVELLTDDKAINFADRAANFVVRARSEGEKDNQTIILYRHGEGRPQMNIVPDVGPLAPHPADFPDNVPAPPHPPIELDADSLTTSAAERAGLAP